jgi:Trm5-related predicted tRNA methylase
VDAPPEYDPLVRRLRAGESVETVAADTDTPRAAVERLSRLLQAREAARRVNYRYATEFADLLDVTAADHELDQQLWDDRRALVDAHD